VREHLAGGVAIPPGSVVVVSPWLLHRDPRWWSEPEEFRPERWLEPQDRPRFAFAPFGGGPRVCIGEPFAWMEGTLLLATIANRWRLRPVPGHVVQAQAVVTLRPRDGIPMVPEPRGASSSLGDRTLRIGSPVSEEPPPAPEPREGDGGADRAGKQGDPPMVAREVEAASRGSLEQMDDP
jgi:hypothetical protein